MSFKTWMKIYYPKPADETKKGLEAVEHSLQKWHGLVPKVLRKHGLTHYDRNLEDGKGEGFFIDNESCALCVHYWDEDEDWGDGEPCIKCPLYQIRGAACDKETEEETSGGFENENAPYSIWRRTGNPKPMIEVLEVARDQARKTVKPTVKKTVKKKAKK